MENKTAMMELIEWVELRFNNPKETEIFKKATKLLEKEKEQIFRAYVTGREERVKRDSPARYYHETYKQD